MPKLQKAQWAWLGVLAAALALAQINQPYPEIAPLQHVPTLLLLLAAPWLLRRWPISDTALGCVVGFFLLHTLGGRYTYSNVPYAQWYHTLTGGDWAALTGWTRNDYDRLVHFAFGVLFVRPVSEVARIEGAGKRGALWAALGFVLSVSCLYEIFEWALAVVVAPGMADDYNGQQGDMWDSQKDMAMATLGVLLGIGARLLGKRHLKEGVT